MNETPEAELLRRTKMLKEWVASPRFGRANGRRSIFGKAVWYGRDKAQALAETEYLRGLAAWVRYKQGAVKQDAVDWKAAKDWCEAERDETRTDLFETLSRLAPPRSGETREAYMGRLEEIRSRAIRGP